MSFNGFISHMDLAQVVLYIFWLFFARLIYYLIQENKREGYPLAPDVADRSHGPWIGFPPLPSDRVYLKTHGGTYTTPNASGDDRPIALVPTARFPGAPLEPTGNPLIDGVGPASYALRADTPDRGWDGEPTLAPLRIVPDFGVATRDPDPRGMKVLGTDGRIAGTIADAWVDKAEVLFRYYEVALEGTGRHVLLPVNFCRVDGAKRLITVKAITAAQFADVPGLANPDQVTLLEEDKICGYFGGGYLYATLARAEPLL
jgi:photosynthetic reaction center H subunit